MSRTLRLHAKIWKLADICSLEAPPVQNHGWDKNADILWTEKSFPDDLDVICAMSMRRIITAAKMTRKIPAKVNLMKVIAMTKMGIKIDNIILLVLTWS